ncbi:hypothetical protein [Haloferula helveola]|uniref:hypothetical protein n=1 Tax=Haloferula helveola TaxID=490095 RepID=UPI0030D46A24
MKRWSFLLVVLLFPVGSVSGAEEGAEFRFSKIIGDHMVLQQGKPVRIRGWAKPGAEVEVTITRDGEVGAAAIGEATEEGSRDEARIRKDDGSYSMTIRYEERNAPEMASQTVVAKAAEDGSWVALFEPVKGSFQRSWIIARSDGRTVAVRDVLFGEVWLCAGQSNMEWKDFNRKRREVSSANFPGVRYVAWNDSSYKPLDDIRPRVSWRECTPENAENFSAVPYLYGVFLHRYLKVPVGIINVARGGTTGDTWCLRDELDGIDHVTVTETLRAYDAETAMWDDPEGRKKVMDEWERAKDAARAAHEERVAEAKAAGKPEPRLRLPKEPQDPRNGWSPPAGLFNATVMPIRWLGLAGVLYYQGENNVFMRWTRYEHTFPKVPLSFRKAFGDDDLPFGCISQPGWGRFGTDPEVEAVTGGYAIIRDIQRRALKNDSNAGMIATYPTGNSYIHPGEKFPVAEYASLWALARVYGEPVIHRANEFKEMEVSEGKAHLYFDADPVVYERWKHIENNASWQVLPQPYQGNAPIEGFIIAGEDRRWYPAEAKEKRVDGTWTIEVSSDLVPEPVAVRYGWASWPTGNLVGRDNLPLATFRTDDWPIIEGVSYSAEARKAADDRIKALQERGERLALDRKIRQMEIDLPELERELHQGDADAQLRSKLERIGRILEGLGEDPWLSNALEKGRPELVKNLEILAQEVEALRAGLEDGEPKASSAD